MQLSDNNIACSDKLDPTPTPRSALDIEDFLHASTDASSRSRTMVLILAVANILAFSGLLNSLQGEWMHLRMKRLGDIRSEYTRSKLGAYPTRLGTQTEKDYDRSVELYERRYVELCAAVERSYVENSFLIRIPVLGFAIDVNDLGLLGGIAFAIILSCYRFFLSREIDNLRISFAEASANGYHKLQEFYKLLAMRQVFTVPSSPYITRSKFLTVTPKAINWFPVIILLAVIVNDLQTKFIGDELGKTHYLINVSCEIVAMLFVAFLSYSVTIRLRRMDGIWAEYWNQINEIGSGEGVPADTETSAMAASGE